MSVISIAVQKTEKLDYYIHEISTYGFISLHRMVLNKPAYSNVLMAPTGIYKL